MRRSSRAVVRHMAVMLFLLLTRPAYAINYTESTQGDVSDNPLAPTVLPLSLISAGNVTGSNVITGKIGRNTSSGVIDRDYFHVVVPVGFVWTELRVGNQVTNGGSQGSFIGLASGSTMPVSPSAATARGLMGWTLYSGINQATTNILDDMAAGHPVAGGLNGASGFIAPLPAGDYTLWIQETAPGAFNYRFNLLVSPVPEPSALVLAALGLVGLLAQRRQREV